ncbi:hypothetical protein N7475_008635 [Penicillium sp. IBT 31633x]|nr:hypothetical protein N7475_008635 [Penicillium sp. IBT 31633x]
MQLTQLLVATGLLATSAFAAPAASGKSMMAAGPQWTIQNAKRVCTAEDTACTWTFGIYPGTGDATPCSFTVKGNPKGAARANGGPATCGGYTVTSGWSGQFGEGNGFTTLSVVENESRQIIWPAYTDKQLAGGKVVKPDQSYAPAALP